MKTQRADKELLLVFMSGYPKQSHNAAEKQKYPTLVTADVITVYPEYFLTNLNAQYQFFCNTNS